MLAVAEKQIFADAIAAASSPDRAEAGHLLCVERKLDGGHVYRTFQGHRAAGWMNLPVPSEIL
jgi:hypothetical protein